MKLKRIIAGILALITVLTLTACGNKKSNDDSQSIDKEQHLEETVQTPEKENIQESESTKPSATDKNPENKPQANTTTNKKPENNTESKPETTPEVKPEVKPEAEPEVKPQPQASTVGQKLLADFNSKASTSSSAISLAEAIVANPIIPFSGATMAVEPGLLSGFGNTEITGFKEGAMFGPVIGSVPFIGYVFVLEDGTNVSNFISTLKSNADLRWNICVEADEMVSGSSGNKVFFVMCPKDFSEE